MRGYNVYKDVWSAANGITLPCQQERFLFERSIWSIANLIKILNGRNTPYSAASLATLAFSSAENFSYLPCVAVPFSIVVSTTGFISSLTASIC